MIASEMDLPIFGDSLQLTGWPNGAQPDPEIPLNLLDLPPKTKLRHQAVSASRWDDRFGFILRIAVNFNRTYRVE